MTSDKASPQRKRLLVLTSTFPRWEGDTEPPFVFELCRRLLDRFDVVILAPHALGAMPREYLAGMEVIRFRYFFDQWEILAYQGGIMAKLKQYSASHLLVPFFLASQLIALHRILKREKIDMIHAHWLIPQGLVALAARFLHRGQFPAWLCTSHGSDLLGLRGGLFAALKRMVMRHANAITVVSYPMKTHALALGANERKLSVIPMGIDMTDLFVPTPADGERPPELLFVGRLVASKAAEILIKAMPAILAGCPEAALTVIGDGPEKAMLEALTKTLGISDRVNFLGAIANPKLPAFYQRAAIFVSPSLEEGFGLTLVEAMACGCTVIASDLPATREIVVDGKTGLTVPPGDSAAVARGALLLLSDAALRRLLGHAGREFALDQFDWEVIASRYGCLLDEIAASPRQPSCEYL